MFDNLDVISLFAMLVSLTAMLIQLVFGVLNLRRAKAETDRQIAETRKQERLIVMQTEETYKSEVRNWGRQVVDAMAKAQQLCATNPADLSNHDYEIERGNTVSALRGLLNRAKWLFPNLAVPTRESEDFTYDVKRHHSALETILFTYHTLNNLDPEDADKRKVATDRIRKFRNEFVREMRRAVDPQVRGADIEKLVAEIDAVISAPQSKGRDEGEA